ncbi:MAG: hypothetical protein P1V20_06995 [Verrucomicrobiales bacterium]|nr:hypothetical protein [Verrucomicrobiales bacterium]
MTSNLQSVSALVPAVAAFCVAFLVRDVEANRGVWFLLVVGLLVFGGAVAASCVTGRILMRRPDRSSLFVGVLFAAILVAYVTTFFFTGKLLSYLGVLH